MAARCISVLAQLKTPEAMSTVLEILLPWLNASQDEIKRQGSIEALASILCHLSFVTNNENSLSSVLSFKSLGFFCIDLQVV